VTSGRRLLPGDMRSDSKPFAASPRPHIGIPT
jgi:hypothetical protein